MILAPGSAPTSSSAPVTIIPVPLSDEVSPGDDLAQKLRSALRHQKLSLRSGDVLVIKHKIVSKAEGRIIAMANVKPSRPANTWAEKCGADARLIQLALSEARRVVRKKVVRQRGVLITETRHGFICANSGVDVSNVDGGEHAVLLPEDPDFSAAHLRRRIKTEFGVSVAVIISDSFGRPWREGLTEVAIGVAGIKPLIDYRGKRDPHGYVLHASADAVADELACAAGLVCGKLNRTPFCIVRGFSYPQGSGTARDLIRPKATDLFR
jgi:coenzyme F420-0:L-glutamate ligase/coenzyme F420-1:gamma-L-glutamate ligase